VERSSADLVEPDLVNLVERLPREERYSYVYRGSAQALDHVLVSASLLRHLNAFEIARCNADFPAALAADPARPERSSDHDAAVATFVTREPHPLRRRLTASP
jgi:predicted extracellular nuclease